jgi:hypothetical protein
MDSFLAMRFICYRWQGNGGAEVEDTDAGRVEALAKFQERIVKHALSCKQNMFSHSWS